MERGSGLLSGLVFLARPDGALLAIVLLADRWAESRSVPWRRALVAAAVALPWLTFSCWSFGSPFPDSLGSKSREGLALYGPGAYLLGHRYLWDYRPTAVALLPLLLAALPGMVVGWRSVPWYRAVLVWAILHAACYAAIHPPPYMSYYVPLIYAAALAAGLLVQRLLAAGRPARLGAVALSLGLLACHTSALVHFDCLLGRRGCDLFPREGGLREWDYLFFEHEAYAATGRWLRENTSPGSLVGLFEAGIVGYVSERRMTDRLGVVTPDAMGRDVAGWVAARRPDYLVFPVDFRLPSVVEGSYALEHRVHTESYLDILIYRRRSLGEPPPPSPAPIALGAPLMGAGASRPPTLRWEGEGPFEVDVFLLGMLSGFPPRDLWYRSSFERPPLEGNEFPLPEVVWGRIPASQPLLWRVRKVTRRPPHRTLAWSETQELVK